MYKWTYLPEFVYGSIDGIITTFAIISGSLGANFSVSVILILGFANLFADGFSMGISNYLSEKSKIKKLKKNPFKTALATFLSFVIIGFIPLSAFLLSKFSGFFYLNQIILSIVFTAAALILVGYIEGILLNKNKFYSIMQILLLGIGASLIAYGIGYIAKLYI